MREGRVKDKRRMTYNGYPNHLTNPPSQWKVFRANTAFYRIAIDQQKLLTICL